MKTISLPNYISRSGARFETTDRFLQSTSVVNSTETELESAGIPLTHIDENTYATSTDELHCFVIGDSGCGKTRRVILPTIRLLAKAGESMVISDPKGELFKTTAKALKEKGYTVQVLNFRNPSRGHRWNPLGLIDKLYHSEDGESRDKALMMLSDIVDVLQQGLKGENDPYWAMAAADVMRGISMIILDYGVPGDLTFENIALTAREVRDQLAGSRRSFSSPGKSFKEFLSSLPKGSPIYQNLSVIITNADDTRNCIMSTFEAMISLYSSQESLMDLFAVSEIDINSLGLSPTALFFILPDDTEALYPIATVFVKQIYSSLISLADAQRDGKLPNRVTFLLDEFANFAKMPSIESMLTAARSRRIRFVLVCQSMDQLTAKYQDHGRETLLANCRTWLYMSCRNLPFLKRLEELVGYYISPYTNEKMPLIGIDDLQHLERGDKEKDCEVLILNDRCRPMMGYLPDYSKYDFGMDGKGVSIELPEPHDKMARKLFRLDSAMEKAKIINAPIIEQKKQEVEQESDGLRASIFEKIAAQRANDEDKSGISADVSGEQASPDFEQKSDNEDLDEFDAGSFVAWVDARIAELEAAEKQANSGNVDETEELSVFELFRQGNYLAAAQQSIEQASILNSISSKNNIAFLIRFGELDTTKLAASFSLRIPDLLKEGLEAKDPYSMVNYSLYEIKAHHFKKAADMLTQLSTEDWEAVAPFWINEVFDKHDQDPEGALVALLASSNTKSVVIHDDLVQKMLEIARKRFGDFMDSPHFKRVYKERPNRTTPKSDKGNDFSSMLDLLLSDDEGVVEEPRSGTDESVGIEDMKAQLQKKIQEKLEKSAEKPDEEDED